VKTIEEEYANDIVKGLEEFTNEERLRFFEILGERYCLWCGFEQPKTGRLCQCRNDG
jgi:hypothetical protein